MDVIKDEEHKRIIFYDEWENEIHAILMINEKNNLFIKNGWNVNYEIQKKYDLVAYQFECSFGMLVIHVPINSTLYANNGLPNYHIYNNLL